MNKLEIISLLNLLVTAMGFVLVAAIEWPRKRRGVRSEKEIRELLSDLQVRRIIMANDDGACPVEQGNFESVAVALKWVLGAEFDEEGEEIYQ